MKIRTYQEADWEALHTLYNHSLREDPVTREFFLEHLILSPNFDPAGVFLAEENGRLTGAAVAQILSRPPSPWQELTAGAKETGYLMPLLLDDAESGAPLLEQAEDFFRRKGCSRVQSTAAGPTLFPDGVDPVQYPAVHRVFEEKGYQKSSIHYSMRCDLDAYRLPEEIASKRELLAESGIHAKVCEYEDLPAVRRFLESGDLIGRMANIADKLSHGELHEVILIRSAAEVLGFCQYNYYTEAERVGPFGVASSMRGKGIGQVMVAKLLETMRERGCRTAYFASCSEPNTHFYAKNGFRIFRAKTIFVKTL